MPREYATWLPFSFRFLNSHRGYDRGALEIARSLARALRAPLLSGRQTRLLVDLNRPAAQAFAGPALTLTFEQRRRLVTTLHTPHWDAVRAAVARAKAPQVLHLGCHSFTPVLRGRRREVDIGLLFDPQRRAERELAVAWQWLLKRELPGLVIRRNAPYRGASPGLTTSLRAEYSARRYLGLELECNQRLLSRRPIWQSQFRRILAATLRQAMASR